MQRIRIISAFIIMGFGFLLGAVNFLLFFGMCVLLAITAIVMSIAALQMLFQ